MVIFVNFHLNESSQICNFVFLSKSCPITYEHLVMLVCKVQRNAKFQPIWMKRLRVQSISTPSIYDWRIIVDEGEAIKLFSYGIIPIKINPNYGLVSVRPGFRPIQPVRIIGARASGGPGGPGPSMGNRRKKKKKHNPGPSFKRGPVIVSDTLCPAKHIFPYLN